MQSTTRQQWVGLMLFSAVLFGGMARLMPALITRFPLNDGGMFFDMTRELAANHYLLPATTAYNGLDLPYAYPPFGFYLTSLLADLGRIPLLDLFLWLPAFFSILAIPAFYLFVRALLADDLRAALATLFFALTPGGYFWHIMGGGVTRATGMLFLLLGAYFAFRLFATAGGFKSALQNSAPAILFCSLAVLSHPEVALQTAGLCAILWLFFGRTLRGILRALILALGVALLTSPWWAGVVAVHGIDPFLSAIQSGQHASIHWLELLGGVFLSGEFLPLLLVLRLAGLGYAIWKKQYLLLALTFLPVFLDPRSAGTLSSLGFAMLASFGFLDAIPALFKRLREDWHDSFLDAHAGKWSLAVLGILLFLQCGLRNYTLINTTLAPAEREAMAWAAQNLPPGQSAYLLTGRTYSMSDPAQEWFPTLTGHHSQTTLQGLEWTLGPQFAPRLEALAALQACPTLACVETWSARTGLEFDILWLNGEQASLVEDARGSSGYALVFESEAVLIFQRMK